jgi:hypothetical protein
VSLQFCEAANLLDPIAMHQVTDDLPTIRSTHRASYLCV